MDAVSVQVRIPLPFRRHVGGASTLQARGRTIAEVIDDLDRRHPGFRERVLDADGRLHRHINVYQNGDDVRYHDGLETALGEGDRIQIVPAAAGGAQWSAAIGCAGNTAEGAPEPRLQDHD